MSIPGQHKQDNFTVRDPVQPLTVKIDNHRKSVPHLPLESPLVKIAQPTVRLQVRESATPKAKIKRVKGSQIKIKESRPENSDLSHVQGEEPQILFSKVGPRKDSRLDLRLLKNKNPYLYDPRNSDGCL